MNLRHSNRLCLVILAILIMATSTACGTSEYEYHKYSKKELGSMVYVKKHGIEYAEIEVIIDDGKKGMLVYVEKKDVKKISGQSYVVTNGNSAKAYLSRKDYKLIFD